MVSFGKTNGLKRYWEKEYFYLATMKKPGIKNRYGQCIDAADQCIPERQLQLWFISHNKIFVQTVYTTFAAGNNQPDIICCRAGIFIGWILQVRCICCSCFITKIPAPAIYKTIFRNGKIIELIRIEITTSHNIEIGLKPGIHQNQCTVYLHNLSGR
jgi:hypothetical protein